VVAVTATQSNDALASWSSYGPHVAVTAPGVTIWTTNRDGNYGAWSGTSFASPVVAGVAALVASVNPALTSDEIVDILKSTADDLGTAGFDEYFGYGRVNASRAVQAAQGSLPADTTAPVTQITSPTTGATVSGTVSIAVASSDNVGVTRVDLYIDGKFYKTSTSTSAVFSWNTKNVKRGTHTLQSFAWDAAGNMGSSAIVTVKR
jgi:subtilisin family serine protease